MGEFSTRKIWPPKSGVSRPGSPFPPPSDLRSRAAADSGQPSLLRKAICPRDSGAELCSNNIEKASAENQLTLLFTIAEKSAE